ncbi:unnamed protein product [Peniophora sp. CBMAI 1063]|nr:unnamed protein product [Peniophora sp. CBMAI 1063]
MWVMSPGCLYLKLTDLQTNVDQMAQFAKRNVAAKYANCIVEYYGPPKVMDCADCGKIDGGLWHCDGCRRDKDLCTPCIRKRHMSNPFHRVRYFTGMQYREASLRDAGIFIQLCPMATGTNQCPGYEEGRYRLPAGFDDRVPPHYGSSSGSGGGRGGGSRSSTPAGGVSGLRRSDGDGPEERLDSEPQSVSGQSWSVGEDPDDPLWNEWAGSHEEMDEGEVEAEEIEDEDEESDDEHVEGVPRKRGRNSLVRKDSWGYKVMVLAHEHDLHALGVAFCVCREGRELEPDEQMLRYGGLFPATSKSPRTAFTVEGLACQQIERLECKVSVQAISRKIRRITRPLHPSTVVNRYREHLRVMRQYTAVDSLIVHGYAHQDYNNWRAPPPGGLFHKCVVCPSVDNLPPLWERDPNAWAIFFSWVHDGNFSAQHTVSKEPGNNVPLFPGTGAFQHPDEVRAALKKNVTDRDLQKVQPELFANDKPCHKHQAAAVTGKSRNKITDIKGIGSWACARHGHFAACGTCNYELGEGQGPADLALSKIFEVCTDAERVRRIQILYDIWCQYGKHLRERFDKSPHLSWPEFEEVMGGVGVWHIFGHVFECYGRYSTQYARHTGIVDGEILETLWSILNGILESCRGMSLAHREEVITLFQSDSNLRKTLDMADTLARKWDKYQVEMSQRNKLLVKLSMNVSEADQTKWEMERQRFEHLQISDPLKADELFGAELTQVPSRKDTETELLEDEANLVQGGGLVQALISSVNLQVDQLKLQAFDKQATTASDRRTLAGNRTKLHNRINKCNTDMAAALRSKPSPGELAEVRLHKLMEEDEWGGPAEPPRHEGERNLRRAAEFRPVDLPSARSFDWRKLEDEGVDTELGIKQRAMEVEGKLLMARMEEELGQVRTTIIDQANTYLQKIRSGGGNETRGHHLTARAYEEVQNQGKAVRLHAQIYNMCATKLRKLDWDTSVQGKEDKKARTARYRFLEPEHLKCSTATYSTRGTSPNFVLPWFWRMVPEGQDDQSGATREEDEQFVAEC